MPKIKRREYIKYDKPLPLAGGEKVHKYDASKFEPKINTMDAVLGSLEAAGGHYIKYRREEKRREAAAAREKNRNAGKKPDGYDNLRGALEAAYKAAPPGVKQKGFRAFIQSRTKGGDTNLDGVEYGADEIKTVYDYGIKKDFFGGSAEAVPGVVKGVLDTVTVDPQGLGMTAQGKGKKLLVGSAGNMEAHLREAGVDPKAAKKSMGAEKYKEVEKAFYTQKYGQALLAKATVGELNKRGMNELMNAIVAKHPEVDKAELNQAVRKGTRDNIAMNNLIHLQRRRNAENAYARDNHGGNLWGREASNQNAAGVAIKAAENFNNGTWTFSEAHVRYGEAIADGILHGRISRSDGARYEAAFTRELRKKYEAVTGISDRREQTPGMDPPTPGTVEGNRLLEEVLSQTLQNTPGGESLSPEAQKAILYRTLGNADLRALIPSGSGSRLGAEDSVSERHLRTRGPGESADAIGRTMKAMEDYTTHSVRDFANAVATGNHKKIEQIYEDVRRGMTKGGVWGMVPVAVPDAKKPGILDQIGGTLGQIWDSTKNLVTPDRKTDKKKPDKKKEKKGGK